MRVVLFTDADVFAGTERHILDLARGLRPEGVEVRIACPSPAMLAERASQERFEVVTIQKRGLVDRAAIRTLMGLLRSNAVDLIHAHNGRTMLSSALAVTLAGKGRAVATQHFLEPDHVSRSGPKALLYRSAHRWVNRHTAQVIAISEAVRAKIRERAETPDSKIKVVHNGITPPDTSLLASPEQVRQELGCERGTPLVVSAARLEREKDLNTLIEAMHTVRASCPSAVCIIAGMGTQEPKLRDQVRRLGLEKTVLLLGFRQDVHALMQAADVFVLPSLAEPFGLVLLEAMALGRPVIATRAGGPVEIVGDGETGLLVPPSDATALSEAILQLLMDPEIAQTMGQNGKLRFHERFTVEHMARKMREIYTRIL
ncbi:MAG TPA: glycosyltransferase family 4 protein [Chthonomonadaceae bacterium]|nr:glycosyltransferase family 4 protein [Chthonomonadaceae bacterium]